MSDLPVTAVFENASPAESAASMRDALGASALERLAPVLVALLCLWGLVYWALR